MDALARYLGQAGGRATVETVNYISSLELVRRISPEVASSIVKELEDQRCGYLKLIASENFSSLSVQAAMANLLTDKYAEGFPGHRFYAGCDNVDAIESLAVEKAKELFGAEHAYVQPHSGADANLCAYWAILNPREVPQPAPPRPGLLLWRPPDTRLQAEHLSPALRRLFLQRRSPDHASGLRRHRAQGP